MGLVERLRGLGADLGRVANKEAFTPSERGRSAAEIAITVLEAADALEKAEAEAVRLKEALEGLRRGSCWCEVAIGNPNLRGKHTPQCLAASVALSPSTEGGDAAPDDR